MKTSIFAADVAIFTGKVVTIFIESDELSAKRDMGTAASEATRMAFGMFRLNNFRKTTRREIASAEPIKSCREWAWIKYQ